MSSYDYPTAFSHWGTEEYAAIQRVVISERFTMGPEVAAFEKEFAEYHGMDHGIMVNSGSSANLIAVAALFHLDNNPLRRGDKVVVPALAWSTTYAPLVQYGLDLVLVDCDETWNANIYSRNFDPQDARLVVGCSILGNPADLHAMREMATNIGAFFIEDNCESLGAVSATTQRCGTFGLMNTFSFFYSHQISAIEGGMILTNDSECAMLCRILRAHGWTRDIKQPETFADEYDFVGFGYNVRPVEIHAAIAREQLKKLDSFITNRQANLACFLDMTKGLPITPPKFDGGFVSPFSLHFNVNGGPEVRYPLVKALREAGIDCRLPTGGSFIKHKYGWPWEASGEVRTPLADRIHECGMFLGNAPYSIFDRIERAVTVMKRVL